MREEVVTENVHSMIGICWNLKRRCSTSNSWGDLYQRKKNRINHEATYFRETKFSNSWGDLYQLEMIMRRIILGEKHTVIQKVINFREGWWGEGKGEVNLNLNQEIWQALTWLVEVSTISNIARTVAITTSLHLSNKGCKKRLKLKLHQK